MLEIKTRLIKEIIIIIIIIIIVTLFVSTFFLGEGGGLALKLLRILLWRR